MLEKSQPICNSESYVNRELSWLNFAQRVLAMAEDRSSPLLERVKFAGIMGMLYDEFCMKRIGGLRRKIDKKNMRLSSDGLTPREELAASRKELRRQTERLCLLIENELRPALASAGLPILDYQQLNADQQTCMRQYFRESVEPILTPLAVDVGHPFPFISNLGINIALQIKKTDSKKPHFIRIKVPPNRPRWVEVPGGGYVPIEQIIGNNLDLMFSTSSPIEYFQFRVTRGAKDNPWDRIPIDEEEPDLLPGSIIGMVTTELRARKFAGVVRLQVGENMPKKMRDWLTEQLDAHCEDVMVWKGLMNLTDLVGYQPEGYVELRDPVHRPVTHPRLKLLDARNYNAIFDEIRRRDLLIHLPYHEFDTSVLRFLQSAAKDPKVLAIKI
jgi:polyphosphate kinase